MPTQRRRPMLWSVYFPSGLTLSSNTFAPAFLSIRQNLRNLAFRNGKGLRSVRLPLLRGAIERVTWPEIDLSHLYVREQGTEQ